MGSDPLYYEAARIVESVRAGKSRLKTLCFSSSHKNKKALFALATTALKEYTLLQKTLTDSQIFVKEKRQMKESLAILFISDVVNDRKPNCSPRLWEIIEKNKTRLKGEYVKIKIRHPELFSSSSSDQDIDNLDDLWTPKYARINTLTTSLDECLSSLKKDNYMLVDHNFSPKDDFSFYADPHIKDLLVFSSNSSLTSLSLYRTGKLVLQDKASCMPVHVLNPPPGSTVLDACAAPGNKTTQAAAAVGTTGSVVAFERDERRFKILKKTLAKHHCKHVEAVHSDFLSVNLDKYSNVTHCIVDPSCSGSGILEEYEESSTRNDPKRLKSLSNFQCMIIRHAMKLKNLKKLVYSTCSINKEENEEVVKQILLAEPLFTLVEDPLKGWHRRGEPGYPFSSSVIRACPKEDKMHGFFVACFERK